MTFKDLQKVIQSQSGPEQSQLLQRLRDKPFWIWDPKQHKHEDLKTKGDCCFNHIIGLPRKDGKSPHLCILEMITERKRILAADNERDIAITLGNLISRVINNKTLSIKG